ncbi:MAG TPA: hypothetical protein PKJ36_06490, partial [Flavihumibacter sp.]|nr:hypothetical protein [Flavihumibacter sp.]
VTVFSTGACAGGVTGGVGGALSLFEQATTITLILAIANILIGGYSYYWIRRLKSMAEKSHMLSA